MGRDGRIVGPLEQKIVASISNVDHTFSFSPFHSKRERTAPISSFAGRIDDVKAFLSSSPWIFPRSALISFVQLHINEIDKKSGHFDNKIWLSFMTWQSLWWVSGHHCLPVAFNAVYND